jgi:hypothetical protein
MQMIVRSEQERQSEDIKQRGELADFNGIHAVDGDDSGAGLFEGLAFITELSRVEDHDPVSSGSPFRYQLVHVMKSLNGRKAFHLNVRGTEVAGLGYDR